MEQAHITNGRLVMSCPYIIWITWEESAHTRLFHALSHITSQPPSHPTHSRKPIAHPAIKTKRRVLSRSNAWPPSYRANPNIFGLTYSIIPST
jgi:hypothetical protein